jgi:uncharacterized protein YndB with AHSA1/START domain
MRSVSSQLEIEVSPETVFGAFTELKHLRRWWDVERSLIETRVGGVYALAWQIVPAGFEHISSGIIKTFEMGGCLEIVNLTYFNPARAILGPMRLEINLQKIENGTKLFLCQDGFLDGDDWDWYYETVTDNWPKALEKLKNYLVEMK